MRLKGIRSRPLQTYECTCHQTWTWRLTYNMWGGIWQSPC